MTDQPLALWHDAPRRSAIRPAELGDGDVTVRTLYSLISRGTERLVFEGRVPNTERDRMRAPMQEGDFPFPVKYGYAAVGVVEDPQVPDLVGELGGLGLGVVVGHADEHQDPGPDLTGDLSLPRNPVDGHARPADALHESSHESQPTPR